MADLTYDTTDPDYVQYNNALPGYIAYVTPILKKFRKVWYQDRAAAKAWAKRDPLLMRTLDMLLEGEEYVQSLRGEDTPSW